MRHYEPELALVQLTTSIGDAILDPMLLPKELFLPLIRAICETPKQVIMHGSRNDIGGLKRDCAVAPHKLIDTQIAARFAGEKAFGLASLVRNKCNIRLDKSSQRSDWGYRPLTERQILYAASDTKYLLKLWKILEQEVITRGLEDAFYEECDELSRLPASKVRFTPQGWRKMKGIKKQSTLVKSRVHHLWAWRERVSKTINWQNSRLLPPKALLALANAGIDGFKSVRLDPRVLAAQNELIPLLHSPDPLPENDFDSTEFENWNKRELKERLNKLLQWQRLTAKKIDIDPGFFASRALLKRIANLKELSDQALLEAKVHRWRIKRYAETWRLVLDKSML